MPVDNNCLERWRALKCEPVLVNIADCAKRDPDFQPMKNPGTTRWHATIAGREFELLLTGPKFWDTRAQTGGGGAIDLVMHLRNETFREAAAYLQERRL